jgi:hypothetical protein
MDRIFDFGFSFLIETGHGIVNSSPIDNLQPRKPSPPHPFEGLICVSLTLFDKVLYIVRWYDFPIRVLPISSIS